VAVVTVVGVVHAGEIIADLHYSIYDDNANLLASGRTAADGSFSAQITNGYRGPILAVIDDANATSADFRDEATGELLSLNTSMRAISVVTGDFVRLVVNPLTEVAAVLAGVQPGATRAPASVDAVVATNTAVARAVGLDADIASTVPVIVDAGRYGLAGELSVGEKYGAVLAALSGAAITHGGVSAGIDVIVRGIQTIDGVAKLSDAAVAAFMEGANTADGRTPGPLTSLIASMLNEVSSQAQAARELGADLAGLDVTQLSAALVANLSDAQLATLAPEQIAKLSSNAVATLSSGQLTALAGAVSGMSVQQLGALTPAQVASLTLNQVAGLDAAQVGAIGADVIKLSSAASAGLSGAQLAQIAPEHLGQMNAEQLSALARPAVGAITPAQIQLLSAAQLNALGVNLTALSNATLTALSDEQVAAIDPAALVGLTPAQRQALLGTPITTGGGGAGGAVVDTAVADNITAVAGPNTIDTGDGNDTITIDGTTNLGTIAGGAGTDTLSVTGNLDLTVRGAGALTGIEIINLGAAAPGQSLKVALADVVDAVGTTGTLTVQGGTGDSLVLDGTWTAGVGAPGYTNYTNPVNGAVVAVADGVSVVSGQSTNTLTSAITAVADDHAPVTGNVNVGGATNDTTLALTGTVSAALGAGQTLNVYDGATLLGQATVSGTNWSFTTPVLGGGGHNLMVQVVDLLGTTGPASAAHSVTVDTVAPATPSIDAVTIDNIVNAAEVGTSITGTAEANATVALSLGGNTRTVTATAGGTWSYTLIAADITAMGQGTETISATATDTAGNVSAAATRNITVDTATPGTPAIDAVTIDNILNAAEVGTSITGTAEANATVALTLGGNTRTVTATAGGTWSYTLITADITAMGEGTETLSATATDTAGNTSAAATRVITVDTVTPGTPTIDAVTIDNILNAAEVGTSITGTAEANATVALTLGGNTRTVTATAGGTWSYTLIAADITAMGEGTETISATATDTAGNVSAAATRNITVDTVTPGTPAIDAVTIDNILNAAEVGTSITGTAEANATVALSLGGNTRTVTATAGGTWSYTLIAADITAMGEGTETISATATDTAGNTSAAATRVITVDTVTPGTPAIDAVTIDNILNAAEVGTSITGTAEANATVALSLGGNTRTVTATAGGTWSYTLIAADITAMGEGTETISATATDTAGNTSAAATRVITVDTVTPNTPAIDAVTIDNIVNAAEVGTSITGTAEANATVALSLGGNTRTVTATAGGTWSYTLIAADITAMGEGAETISATATDTAGNVSAAATRVITVDTVTPGTPAIDAVTIDNILNAAEVGTSITGTAEANATVALSLGGNTRTVTATAGGTWSYTLITADITAMGEGTETISATATDTAGNTSAAATRVITVDTATPGTPTIDAVTIDNIVNAAEVGTSITGTAEANATLALSLGGNTRTVTATAGGTWSYTLIAADITAMGEGTETISATATDTAGNTSAAATRTITVDTVTPGTPAIDAVTIDNIVNAAEVGTSITGTAEANATVALSLGGNTRTVTATAGGTWSYTLVAADITAMGEGAETISATATDTAGNVSAAATRVITVDTVTPGTPAIDAVTIDNILNAAEVGTSITGTAEANATIALTLGGNTRTVTATAGGTWSYTLIAADITAMGEGTETISATATDTAGNTSAAATRVITVDTVTPNTPAIDAVTIDNIVNAAEVGTSITGTAEANATVALSLGGNTRTVTATAGGTWSYTLIGADITAMGEGTETLSATATDTAGNTSAAATRTITVDTVTPGTPTIDAVTIDNIVNAAEVGTTITGTAEANATVALSLGGNTRTVTATAGGTWSYTLVAADITAMGEGAETISATATDTAGNVSAAATRTITVDTVTPGTPAIDAVTIDNILNAAEVGTTITGTAEANATVALTLGGNTRTVTATAGGTWSYTLIAADITAMGEGTETISATATDTAGNVSVAATRVITVDTVSPGTPAIDAVTIDNIVNAAEVGTTITGTAEANATVALSLGGNTRTVTATAGGTWSYTLVAADITAMGEGTETISATATDTAGNVSAAATRVITVDTVTPGTPTIDAVTIDNIVNAAEVGTSITGTAEANATVALSLGGNTRTVTATAGGTWSYTLIAADITAMGEGTETLSATATDTAGNVSAAATRTITVDTATPGTPTIDAVTIDNIVNAAEVGTTITGTAEANATVALSLGGNTRTVTATAGGTWSYTLVAADITAMGEGTETISATATDAAGNTSAAATRTITVDTATPGTPTIDAVTIDNIVNAAEVGTTITGTAEANATVALSLGGNTRSVTATAGGTWSYTLIAADITAMGEGTETISATATDTAGNTSAAATRTITVDTVTPGTPTIDAVTIDNIVNAAEVGTTITGTAEANATVALSLGGNTRTVTATAGGTWSYTLIAADITAMGEGTETLSATATDTAGNTSTAATRVITVDTVTPGTPTIDAVTIDNIVNAAEVGTTITGTAEANATVALSLGGNTRSVTATAGGTWSYTLIAADITAMGEGTETISATATDTAGNTSAAATRTITVDTVTPGTPTIDAVTIDNIVNAAEVGTSITGTAEANATVALSLGGNTRTVTATAGGTWSYTLIAADITAMGEGTETLSATATDTAGNTSTAATRVITVDTVTPGTPAIDAVTIDNIVNAAEVGTTITGTAEANATVALTLGGNTRTVTATAGGTWSYTLIAADITAMGEGTETLSATATDTAGNTSAAATRVITVDTAAPVQVTITDYHDDQGALTGTMLAGSTTDDSQPTFRGTAEAGTVVTLREGATVLGTATADGTGAWSITPTASLSEGAHTVRATATDAAGNTSVASLGFGVTLNTSVAGAPSIVHAADNTGAIQGNLSAGSTSDDTTPLVRIALVSSGAVAGDTMNLYDGATLVGSAVLTPGDITATHVDIQSAALAQGAHSLTARITVAATGNPGVSSAAFGLNIDTTAPAAPTLALAADTGASNSDGITSNGVVNVSGLEGSATWQYSTNGGTSWTTGTGTSFSLSAGSYGAGAVQVRQTDVAGNLGTVGSNAGAITVDAGTTTPAIDAVTIDNIVNAAEVGTSITGTAEANATVALSLGGNTRTVTATAGGTWSYTLIGADITAMGEGSETLSATATDTAGNTSTAATRTITVDTATPGTPTIDAVTIDNILNAAEVGTSITGTAEANATVALTLGGNTRTVTATAGGTWSYTLIAADITAMGEGTETISATATDTAGNVSAAATRNITVDTVTPGTPAIDAVTIDNILNAAEVGTSITGTAEANATVALSLGGNTRTVTATAGGTWSYTLIAADITAMGEGTETISATATDTAGNTSAAATRVITVDTVTPGTPAIDAVTIDNILNAAEVGTSITGTAEANATVALSLGGNTRTVTATAGGTWSYTLIAADITAMGEGTETISATATDTAGNTSAAATRVITVDTVTPNTPAIDAVTIDNIVNAAEVGTTITGTAEANATVALSLGGNTRTVTATAGGTWSYTLVAADITAMGEGTETISATATDTAGNTSTAATRTITVDTATPGTPAIDAVTIDNIVNAAEVGTTITGTAEANATVALSLGGNTRTVTATAGGTWSYTLIAADITAMGEGTETISATATDTAGNTSAAATRTITVDTVTPGTPAIDAVTIDNIVNAAEVGTSITGTAEANATVALSLGGNTRAVTATAGGTWSYTLIAADITAMGEGTETLSATATDTAGNVSAAATRVITVDTVAPGTPAIDAVTIDNIVNAAEVGTTITGTNEAGATVALSLGGNTRAATVTGTTWSYTLIAADITAMGQGTETLSATATDTAGNVSTAATRVITVDTVTPAVPTLALAADTGTSNSDGITSNGVVNVSGLEGSSTWQYSTNNGTSWTTGTGTNFTLSAGSYGAGAVQVRQTDVAGNPGTAGSNAGAITVDTTAPTLGSVAISSNAGPDNAYMGNDVVSVTATFDGAVNVTGAPTLTLNVGGVSRAATYTGGSGSTTLTFSYTVQGTDADANGISIAANSLALNGGTIRDAAGNAAVITHSLVADNPVHQVVQLLSQQAAARGMSDAAIGYAASWGDYDGDGDLDLFVANQGQDFLYRNNGNGSFTRVDTVAGLSDAGFGLGASWGDYDGDGDLDLFVSNWSGQQDFLYRNNGNGSFTRVDTAAGLADAGSGRAASWGDYDGDGDLDLFVANDGQDFLYRNNGNASFTRVDTAAGLGDGSIGTGASWGDYDGDGDLDLFVANYTGQDFLYRNNGNGSFTRVDTAAGLSDAGEGYGASWGDYDGDGDLDLFVANFSGQQDFLYRNNGNGSFTRVDTVAGLSDAANGVGASWGDYDGDGDLDLFVANNFQDFLYRNNGNGSFTRVDTAVGFSAAGNGFGSSWGDYDGDGDLDLFVANYSGQDFLYTNNSTATAYLDVAVKQAGGAANLEGAKVEIFNAATQALVATRTIDAGDGHASHQPSVRFAGLDDSVNYDVRVTYNNNGTKTVVTDGTSAYNVAGATMVTNASYDNVNIGTGAGEVRGVVLTAEAGSATGGSSLIQGSSLAERIVGDTGNDRIRANAGNDVIDLSAGGADRVEYNTISTASADGGNGNDRISGFTLGSGGDAIDVIDLLERTGFTSTGVAATDAAALVATTRMNLADSAEGLLVQVDRDGGGSYQSIATLAGISLADISGSDVQAKLATLLGNGNLQLHLQPTVNATTVVVGAEGQITGTFQGGADRALTVTLNGVDYRVGDGRLTTNGDTWQLTTPALTAGTYNVTASVSGYGGSGTVSDATTNELMVGLFSQQAVARGMSDGSNSGATSWGDYDGDGDLDLFVANYGEQDFLYRNNGNGSFTRVDTAAGLSDAGAGYGASWGDYDGDGDLDLFVPNQGQDFLYRNNGNGSFTRVDTVAGLSDTATGWGGSWGDYDGDGDLDLFVSNTGQDFLYRNNGNSSFTRVDTVAGLGDAGDGRAASWGDYDGDGDMDLFVANGGQDFLYRNNGNGSFTRVDTAAGLGDAGTGQGVSWGDYDGDGDLDLFVANYGGEQDFLYRNNGNGSFIRVDTAAGLADAATGTGASWGDYDGDGDLDLFVSNYSGQQDFLYRNNGNGSFTRVDTAAGLSDAGSGSGVSWGDYDGDGDLDLFVSNFGSQDFLYTNNSVATAYLDVAVKQAGGAANLVGAKVEIFNAATQALVATRSIDAGDGYSIHQPSVRFAGLDDSVNYDVRVTYNNNGTKTVVTDGTSAYNVAGATMVTNASYDNVNIGTGAGEVRGVVLTAESGTSSGGSSLIQGSSLAERIVGDTGNDRIRANAGNDVIDLSAGGADRVEYNTISTANADGGNGNDRISGFTLGSGGDAIDVIDLLERTGFTSTGVAATDAAALVATTRMNLADSAEGLLVQVDRDGGGSYQSIATLAGISLADISGANVQAKLATLLGNGNLQLHLQPTVNTASFMADTEGVITGTFQGGADRALTVTLNSVVYRVGDGRLTTNGDTWQLTTPALATGTYSVTASVSGYGGSGTVNDGTVNELMTGFFSQRAVAVGMSDSGAGAAASWGDYDGDGDLDLFVANFGEQDFLYRNNGNGSFTRVDTAAGLSDAAAGYGASWGDYDGDGDLDLFVPNQGQDFLYRNNGNGSFTRVDTAAGLLDAATGFSASWGDYDGDGDLDLYVANSGQDFLYRNTGNGSFTRVDTAAGLSDTGDARSASWGDYDGDGDLDLFVSNTGQDFLYRNNGNGSFTRVDTAAGLGDAGTGQGASWGDYDGDGDLDLFVANYFGEQDFLYRNNGNGSFTRVDTAAGLSDAATGLGASWGDYDGDGDLDLFVANYGGQDFLYRNNGNGDFTRVDTVAGLSDTAGGFGVSWGDYDADGDLDLSVANYSSQDFLYTNNSAATAYLDVAVKQAGGAANLVGAKVEIFNAATQALVATRSIDTGDGFASHQPSVRFAGLNDSVNYDVRVTYNNNGTKTVVTDGTSAYNVAGATMVTNAAYDSVNIGTTSGEVRGVVLTAESGTSSGGSSLIQGSSLAERIVGDTGNDRIRANAGNDVIDLAAGGADRVEYNTISTASADGGNGNDRISGFTLGSGGDAIDVIDLLERTGFTSTGDAATDAAALVSTTRMTLADSAEGLLVQVDRDGGGSYQSIATLAGISLADISGANVQAKLATLLGNGNLQLHLQPTVNATTATTEGGVITGTFQGGADRALTVTLNSVVYRVGDGRLTTNGDTWQLTTPALALGTYNVTASVSGYGGSGTVNDATTNELTVISLFSEQAVARGLSDAGNSRGASWGDYDGDGDLDLFVANLSGQDFLYRNDGNGSFTRVDTAVGLSDALNGYGASWGDYDGDGDLDLFVANDGGQDLLYRNDGNASFTRVDTAAGLSDAGAGQGATWGDYDGDGDLDLFVVNIGGQDFLYRNNGNGSFMRVDTIAGLSDAAPGRGASWGDYDGDGDLDLFVANETSQSFLYRNNGNSSFTRVDTAAGLSDIAASQSPSWGDYDGDGDLDLFVSTYGTAGFLYRNDGNASFTRVDTAAGVTHATLGAGASWGDYDGDGDLDLIVMTSGGISSLYRNNGNGSFTRWDSTAGMLGSSNFRGASWGDYDGDGDLDLFAASTGADLLYTNNSTATAYLDVSVKQAGGAANLVGAKVEIFNAATQALVATRSIDTGDGFASHQPSVRFAGLNDSVNYDVRVTYNNNGSKTVVTDGTTAYNVAGATMVTNAAYDNVNIGNTAGEVRGVVLTAEAGSASGGSVLIQGSSLAERIAGDAGNDVIRGNGGNDVFELSAGGADILQYLLVSTATGNGGNGYDQALGFSTAALGSGGDKIDLSALTSGTPTAGAVSGSAASASEANGFVRLDLAGGVAQVLVDYDGGGNNYAQLLQFATAESSAQTLLQQMLTQQNIVI
jgi:hypothetical protein